MKPKKQKKESPFQEGNFQPAMFSMPLRIELPEVYMQCAHCHRQLGPKVAVNWTATASPRLPGVVIFTCEEHLSQGMNLMGKFLPGEKPKPVRPDLKLPDTSAN